MSFYDDNITLQKFKNRFQNELICEYASDITYQKNAKVFSIIENKIYSSLVYNNLNQSLSDNTKWKDITTNTLLDNIFIDTIIQIEINKILNNNKIIDAKIYNLSDTDPLKQELIFLLIAHNLQDAQNKLYNRQGVEIDKDGIVLSAGDGTNNYSFNVLQYMSQPAFRLYRTTKYGIEYYLKLLTIDPLPAYFVISSPAITPY